jgi:hypothetical protein
MTKSVRRGSAFALTITITVCFGCGSGKQGGSAPGANSSPTASAESTQKTALQKLGSGDESERIQGATEAAEKFGAKPEGTGP